MNTDGAQAASGHDVDRFYRVGRAATIDNSQPPTPVHIEVAQNNGVMVGVLHWTWLQPGPVAINPNDAASPDQFLGMLAHQIQTMPNPIQSLVVALRTMSRECVAQGVIPIGIHLHTTHVTEVFAYERNASQVARIDVAVTVVPHKWVQEQADAVLAQAQTSTDAGEAG